MYRSPTQRVLTPSQIADYARVCGLEVTASSEIEGGGYAAVWKAQAGGQTVVFKVGPGPQVPQLRYERDLMRAEAAYYRLAREAGAPVPEVLHVEDDWLCVSHLPGTPLSRLEDGSSVDVRRELGAVMARVHTLTGPKFGYAEGDRPRGTSWPDVFGAMIEDLLADAVDWGVELPVPPARILSYLDGAVLGEVSQPVLVHYDLWDGNVLTEDGVRLSGLVDGERYLYGDPLIDFVASTIFTPFEETPGHPFALGYGFAFDDAALRRLALYRMHLYLLMVVEGPSRGMSPETRAQRAAWLLDHLNSPHLRLPFS